MKQKTNEKTKIVLRASTGKKKALVKNEWKQRSKTMIWGNRDVSTALGYSPKSGTVMSQVVLVQRICRGSTRKKKVGLH